MNILGQCPVVRCQKLSPAEKRARFYSTYEDYQEFSLPASIMRYITKNPNSIAVYQKLTQSCKLFFVRNPVIIATSLTSGANKWIIRFHDEEFQMNVHCIKAKFWITDELRIGFYKNPLDCLQRFLPKIFQINVRGLYLVNQIVNVNDLAFVAARAETVELVDVIIFDTNGSEAILERVFGCCKEVTDFSFSVGEMQVNFDTVFNLLNMPQFKELVNLKLCEIPEEFDIELMFRHIKETLNTSFYFVFSDSISENFRERVDAVIDEIIETQEHGYKVPYLWYGGIDEARFTQLSDLI